MKRAAVIVGVNRYERDPSIRPLLYADADCTELHGFLKHKAGYDAVRLLRDPTKSEILDAVEKTANGLASGDLLVFFFAGHGIEYAGNHLLLCRPARLAWLKHYDEAIPVDHLRDMTAKKGLARVLILDCCRSDLMLTRGAGGNGFQGEAGLRDVVARETAPVDQEGSVTILCSCTDGKQALELPHREQGLFTAALLEVMQESLTEGKEFRLSDETQDALGHRMTAISKDVGQLWEQRPFMSRSGPMPVLFAGHPPKSTPLKQPLTELGSHFIDFDRVSNAKGGAVDDVERREQPQRGGQYEEHLHRF